MKIVVASCTKYEDAWPGFVHLFRKHWPECPYPLVLVCGGIPNAKPQGLDQVLAMEDRGWCENLREALHGLGSDDPILLMQEDFFITEPVNGEAVEDALLAMQQHGAGFIRLYPCPEPLDPGRVLGGVRGGWRYGPILRGEAYRISCQAAIWCPKYLSQILRVGSSCADFELLGTPASAVLDPVALSLYRTPWPPPLTYLCSAIGRGKWSRDAVRLLRAEGLEVSARAVEEV